MTDTGNVLPDFVLADEPVADRPEQPVRVFVYAVAGHPSLPPWQLRTHGRDLCGSCGELRKVTRALGVERLCLLCDRRQRTRDYYR